MKKEGRKSKIITPIIFGAFKNSDKFGFIPLGPLILPETDKQVNIDLDPIGLQEVTKNQKTYSLMSSQVTS